MTESPQIAPVVVVGAGPVGSVLALELAHHGVPSIVVEQSTAATRHPKMDFLNARSMELLRRLGLTDEIRDMGVPGDQAFNFHWSTGFAQPPVAEWSYWSVDEFRAAMAGTNDGTLPAEAYQRVIGSRLEDLGRRRCRESELVEMREGWSFRGLSQDVDGVLLDLEHRETGRTEQLRTRYVVACDGARSAVRQAAGIDTDEIGPVSQNVNVYFRSSDPALTRHGRFFLGIASGGVTMVSRDGDAMWTAVFPRLDGKPFEGDPVPVLRERLGVHFEVDEVLSVAGWENRLAVARSYRSGSVFLAGDSAHQFFPSGGHGANTGIGDAVDLGWKLAAVVNGWADPELLDSYEAERRPVGLFNREMCFNLMEVWRRFIFLEKGGATHAQLAGYLETQRFQLTNLGIHCGYRYHGSPIVAHEDAPEPEWRPERITPTTWPGGRVPSVRLEQGEEAGTELYDLFGDGFTLVDFTEGADGAPLAVMAAARELPFRYLPVADKNARTVWERDLVLVRPDHHVAWRGDALPEDPAALLNLVTGSRR